MQHDKKTKCEKLKGKRRSQLIMTDTVCVLDRWLLILVINTVIKSNLRRKGFISSCSLELSSREAKARAKGRSLKPGTEADP